MDVATGGGSNFGWSRMEGTACFKPRNDCDKSGIILPVEDYPPRSGNCSVIGGVVYRGSDVPEFRENYLFADHCKGELRVLDTRDVTTRSVSVSPIGPGSIEYNDPRIASFGVDLEGEVYILRFDGPILKIVGRP